MMDFRLSVSAENSTDHRVCFEQGPVCGPRPWGEGSPGPELLALAFLAQLRPLVPVSRLQGVP